MKKIITLSIIFIICSFTYAQDMPFHKGVNLTGWFQTTSPRSIYFKNFTKKDFERIKSLGTDVIRLPVNLNYMTSGTPDYTVDPLLFNMLDEVIDWAEELEIGLILDNHLTLSTSPDIDKILIPIWSQIAERYKSRSKYIYYEILNEPHDITDQKWNQLQLSTLNAIRKIDTIHTVIVTPAGWGSYNNLAAMPVYADTNLIYTFHFYDPFVFTHQGASWVDTAMVHLAGVPFPYNASRMPVCPPSLRGTWIESSLNSYVNDGTETKVKSLINIADNFRKSRNVKIYCGELGVYMENAPADDRVYWYRVVREYLESKNIPWTTWDYKGAFGVFEKFSNELFDYDLNIPLLNSLGFNQPPQQDFVLKPDTTGFDLYTDYLAENLSVFGSGTTDFWNSTSPQSGNYTLYWTGAAQYSAINFSFMPIKDMSQLVANNYSIDFYLKGSTAISFDIRFVDTKESDSDHPWRMRYTLNTNNVKFDGTWQHIRVPLKDFKEHGSWDNAWYVPEGKFDWRAIDRFEIDPEYSNMGTTELWFDNIKILNPDLVQVENDKSNLSFELSQNFPNPFNPETNFGFSITDFGFVTLKIYDVLGKVVAVLINEEKGPGSYKIKFDASNLSSGVYFYQLRANESVQTKKMLLIQ